MLVGAAQGAAPGAGKDRVTAGGGNDTISARDGVRDTIDCGAGRDKVTAVRNDAVKSTCERVVRRWYTRPEFPATCTSAARRSRPFGTRSILGRMAATPTPEGIPQRLAAIRAQMSLLADYL